jgi:regulation of enolase protein 1 (concanavalin A-like superfamily)
MRRDQCTADRYDVEEMHIETIPALLETASPEAWSVTDRGLTGVAPARTDLFTDPLSDRKLHGAPKLLFPTSGDFLLEAEVEVEFASTFDAGVLLLWQDGDHWAKLCYEYSPQGQPMVVSVVTRGASDDCNSIAMTERRIHLRVGRRGPGCVFHYSTDGSYWHMVRAFRLLEGPMQAGFLVQAPTGGGCRVEFRKIRFRADTLPALRSGE